MIKKILNLYNKLGIGIKVSFWFTFCNFFQKGISMLSVPIFTRLMTKEQYGVFSVYQSWYSILTIITTLNLFAGVYNRGLVKYEDDRDGFTSSMQGLSGLVTIVCFALYVVAIPFWTETFELQPAYMITMFAEMLFVPAYLYWSARQRFEYKYKALVCTTIILSLASPIFGIVGVICTENKALARILAYAMVQIVFGVIFYIYNAIKGKKIYVKEYWKYALVFNLPLLPHYLSQIILNQADRIMISRITGAGDAAIYSVAYNISLIMSLLTNAINAAFVPSLYNSLKNKKYENIKTTSTYVIAVAAVLTFVSMLFGPELIRIFAPVEYYEAIWVIPPVAMSVYFVAVYALFVNVEFYFEKTKYTMYVSVIGAIANIALNWIFINKFGYLAAGYTTVVCYAMFAIGHYLLYAYLNKKYLNGIKIVRANIIALMSIVLSVLMFISLVLYRFTFVRYTIILMIFAGIILFREKMISVLKSISGKGKD